ncbi:MAG: AI-2E family transporter [Firmicutes bacterium]|nr:AI-2E family transporter [Bacillota bacterium]
MESRKNSPSISYRCIVISAASALLLLIIYWLIRTGALLLTIIMPFFLATIVAYILNPLVEFLECRRIPRSLGILLIYAILFIAGFIFSVTAIPTLITELQKLGEMIPQYTERFQSILLHLHSDYQRINLPESLRLALDQNILNLQETIQGVLERATGIVLGLFSNMFTVFIIPLVVYYVLRDMDNLKRSTVLLCPKKYRNWVIRIGSEMDSTLGAYFRGMLIICCLVGLLTYLGLLLIGLDFALILGIIAGLTNIIPYFGPIIGAIPAVLLGLLSSPALALKIVIVYIIVQQLENQLIAPQILGRSLGLHPLVVIFVLLLGGKYFGLGGLIFAVPFTAIARILLKNIINLAANRT